MTTMLTDIPLTKNGFPFPQQRGPAAIIGVNSAVATGPFMASGVFSRRQAKGLAKALDIARDKGLFRVILIHHPPVRHAATAQKRLYGIRLFQSVIREHGAELVLHGHTHLPQRHEIRQGQKPGPGDRRSGRRRDPRRLQAGRGLQPLPHRRRTGAMDLPVRGTLPDRQDQRDGRHRPARISKLENRRPQHEQRQRAGADHGADQRPDDLAGRNALPRRFLRRGRFFRMRGC
jgi:3',5'-cyclic AMP phosphodiesterase CpdA